jgi:hypothetical protein
MVETSSSVATITSTTISSTKQMTSIILVFAWVLTIGIHIGLYFFNKDVFNIIMSIYIIAFAVIFLVFLQKKKNYTTDTEFNMLTYMSMFVIILEIIVLVMSVVSLMNNKTSSSNTKYNYNSKYYR